MSFKEKGGLPLEQLIVGGTEKIINTLFNIETKGIENIPPSGSQVLVFAPHSGWVEPFAINRCLVKADRDLPFWVTKMESAFPRWLVGKQFIYINRQSPEQETLQQMHEVIRKPNATLATAFEGTRFGNPNDPNDILTLGEMKPGFVHLAIREKVPILPVVVLGADKLEPRLDQIFKKDGYLKVLEKLGQLEFHRQSIKVCFLEPYSAHLNDQRSFQERKRYHTHQLGMLMAQEIHNLNPDYPLGPYQL